MSYFIQISTYLKHNSFSVFSQLAQYNGADHTNLISDVRHRGLTATMVTLSVAYIFTHTFPVVIL